MRTRYLIIGNSAGGIGAAEAIREKDRKGSLTIVSDEAVPAYSKPLISKYLSGERTIENILYRPAEFYERNNITFLSGEKITRLEIGSKTAHCEDGKLIQWEKLLLATGGKPIIPGIKGLDKEGVFTFTSLGDVMAINKSLTRGQKAVIIGGGLIGVSASEALFKRGVDVTVVEMKDRVLNTILDEHTSFLAEKAFRKAGIKVITGHTVVEVSGDDSITEAILDDGATIPCDLVIVAIGVLPQLVLASNTEIKINRGVVVDRYMSTTCLNIYACGDVSESYDPVYDENRVIPVWPNAYMGGRVAGFNMAGVRTEYPASTSLNSLNYFGIDIVSAGLVTSPGEDYEVITRQENDMYKKVILKNGLISGLIFAGAIEQSGILFDLMKNKVPVEEFKQALLSDDFGLASLPQKLWKEKLQT